MENYCNILFLRVYLVSSGKQRLAIKAPTSDDGSLIKVSHVEYIATPIHMYLSLSVYASASKLIFLFDSCIIMVW